MKFKKAISVLFMFGFLSSYGFCLPKKCCKTEFQKNVEDIVRSYLRGQLNRKQLALIYGDRLKEINTEQNQAIAMSEYDLGCYQVKIVYLDIKSKNEDIDPKYFYFYAQDEDEEGLPLSVFFDMCGKEDGVELRAKMPIASFLYSEVDSTFRISILVKAIYNVTEKINLRKGSGRTIQLTRYPKSWDEEK